VVREKIAIIGSGISGLTAAYFLKEKYDIKLYEKHNYLGGHSNTIDVNYLGKKIAVDTGFIVFNHKTYPNLIEFFTLMDVPYDKSNMSFAAKINNGEFEYAGTNLLSLFAQTKNLFDKNFWRMLRDILYFNKHSLKILADAVNPRYTIANLLRDLDVGDYFVNYYILPMSGAIWSCPIEVMLKYPAYSFLSFFKNHGLLSITDQPQWYTVKGGSKEYVKKIQQKIGNQDILTNNFVHEVYRKNDGKIVVKSDFGEDIFDKVVLASHPDQSLKMIKGVDTFQFEFLSAFKYQKNLAILHKDESVMPNSKRAWASWVYSKNKNDQESQISVTYWMNNLQNIDKSFPLFVTLNPNSTIKNSDIFESIVYEHPIFDKSAIEMQKKVKQVQGINNIYICGAYLGNGFHEDGISSALNVVNMLGVKAPWQ